MPVVQNCARAYLPNLQALGRAMVGQVQGPAFFYSLCRYPSLPLSVYPLQIENIGCRGAHITDFPFSVPIPVHPSWLCGGWRRCQLWIMNRKRDWALVSAWIVIVLVAGYSLIMALINWPVNICFQQQLLHCCKGYTVHSISTGLYFNTGLFISGKFFYANLLLTSFVSSFLLLLLFVS